MSRHAHDHTAAEPQRLAIEGRLAAGLVDQAIEICAERLGAAGTTVARVLDLGCGPGVHTVGLAERFPAATVVAADASAAMLAQVEARAQRHGLAGRIETRPADLDGDLGALGEFDLAWAAMAVHHAADEVATLRRIGGLLRPAGLVAVLERAEPMAVRLPGELGRPGIWERLRAAEHAWHERAGRALPGAQNAERYPDMLAAAGLEVVVSRTLTDAVAAPDDAATRAFLAGFVQRVARDVEALADPDDLRVLRAQSGWHGATVTSSRRFFVAGRVP